METMSHRYAAILAADVAHYSTLMEGDGEGTVQALKDCRSVFQRCVSEHHGREFGSVGDSLMAEFSSPVEALRAAHCIHTELEKNIPPLVGGERLQVRIGLHAGDVIVEGDDLFGDVVNTSARIQEFAQPASTTMSGFFHEQVKKERDVEFRSLGQLKLKNIIEPITVYEVERQHRAFNWRRVKLALVPYRVPLAAVAGIVIAGALLITYVENRGQPRISGTIEVPPAKSIAVLPFSNQGATDDDVFFLRGIHADIQTQLARLDSFDRVISRTSVERYRGTQQTIGEIGLALGVATILEGSVQQAGERVRVNVNLIDVMTDNSLWGETYDRELTAGNLFAIQNEISREVTAALHISLSDEESRQLQAIPTTSLEAYGEYVRGLEEESKRTPAALYRAEEHFRRAFEIDPNFALAYVGAADALYLQPGYDPKNSDFELEPWQELIDQALLIDPLLGEAYISLASLKEQLGEIDEAERLFDKGIALSPNYHRAYYEYGLHLRNQGRAEESLAAMQKALELAPDDAQTRIPMSRLLISLGRGDESLELLTEGVRQDPGFANYYFAIGDWHENQGALGEALRWARAGRAVASDSRSVARVLCHTLMKLQEYVAAKRCFDELETEFGVFYPDHRIDLLIGRSDFDEARRQLTEYYSQGHFPRLRLEMLRYWVLLGDLEPVLELLPSIEPDLFDEHGSIRADLVFDVKPPESAEDFRNLGRIFPMYWSATALYASGEVDRANQRYDEVLEIMRAARAVERLPHDFGPTTVYDPLNPMQDMWIHGIRQNGPMVIKSIRDTLDYPDFWFAYADAPLFEFLRDDPEWIELMKEIERRVARERQYYEQHKDEPLF